MPDAYTRRARIGPALVMAVPPIALVGIGVFSSEAAEGIPALLLGIAGLAVAGIVRDRGVELQRRLWRAWGGAPTTQRLRWRGALDPERVRRLHARLAMIDGRPLPDAAREASDPAAADRRYEDAVGVLREHCRDRASFPLVFEENAEYGFRRNSLSLRVVGATIAGAASALSLVLVLAAMGQENGEPVRWGVALAVSVVALTYWVCVVNEAWVRRAAERYADRLFECLLRLVQDPRPGAGR